MKLIDPFPIMGIDSGLREVRLTQAEVGTLRTAGHVLDRLRELRNQSDYDEDDLNVDIAIASYTCERLASEGKADA